MAWLPLVSAVFMGAGRVASEDPQAYKGWTVSSLAVTGIDADLARSLRGGLALAADAAIFYPAVLDADIQRARLFLARHGYPRATIASRFAPGRPGRRVAVTLAVNPGAPVRIARIEMPGMPPALESDARERLTTAAGTRLVDAEVHASAERLTNLLTSHGHAHATVTPRLEMTDDEHAIVRFVTEPGPVYAFDGKVIRGIGDPLASIAAKVTDIHRGQRYSPRRVATAQDNLQSLNVFRKIKLSTKDVAPDSLQLEVDLALREPRTLGLSAGYWTDEGPRGRASWVHRNLWQRARSLELGGSISKYALQTSASLRWPALVGPRIWGLSSLTYTAQHEDSYDLDNIEYDLSLAYFFSRWTSVQAGLAVSDVTVDVKTIDRAALDVSSGFLPVLHARWQGDHTDDRIDPTRGVTTLVTTEWSPLALGSDSPYVLGEGRVTWYCRVTGSTILATRLDIGWARPLSGSPSLLPNKRFFAGGALSMRGARRHELGPLDSSGAPLGGEALALASAELRVPLYGKLRAAAFIDTGQVWAHHDAIDLRELETAVGPALMVMTPVGPVRFDLGLNLSHRPAGKPQTVWHLIIGQPF